MSLSQLYHTVRPLRLRQLTGRLQRRWRTLVEDPARFARAHAPAGGGCRWRPRSDFLPPGPQGNRGEDLRRGRFRFLNQTRELGWPPRWRPGEPKLWEYNLHYFEYLFALDYEDARALVRDWIARHPLARGQVGWEPYPLSLRIGNWCTAFFGRWADRTRGDDGFRDALWRSLSLQAGWLSGHLETHLLGNHLLENAAALALCGSCFDGPDAGRWYRTGLALLRAELPEQLLPDGGHFERSPMYHARAAYLLIALANTGDAELSRLVAGPAARAVEALGHMSHPDGDIALLNDSAFGVANAPAELREAWRRASGGDEPRAPRPGPFSLPDTGYHGARGDEGHYLVCDAGPLGPDYLLGHAHADVFSFELSLRGRRVLCDSGVHGYLGDALRRYCRSTRAHNTVEIDGEDQCEFWAVFRVARRGRPRDVRFEATPDGFRLAGWHDGYARLPGSPRHRREIRWHREGVLTVRDAVTAGRPVEVASRLHLHPDCEIAEIVGSAARIRYPGGEFAVRFAGPGELGREVTAYCPEFGALRERPALVYRAAGARVETGFAVADGAGELACDLAGDVVAGDGRFAW